MRVGDGGVGEKSQDSTKQFRQHKIRMKINIPQKNYLVFCFALEVPLCHKVNILFCCPDTDQDNSFPKGDCHSSEAG